MPVCALADGEPSRVEQLADRTVEVLLQFVGARHTISMYTLAVSSVGPRADRLVLSIGRSTLLVCDSRYNLSISSFSWSARWLIPRSA